MASGPHTPAQFYPHPPFPGGIFHGYSSVWHYLSSKLAQKSNISV